MLERKARWNDPQGAFFICLVLGHGIDLLQKFLPKEEYIANLLEKIGNKRMEGAYDSKTILLSDHRSSTAKFNSFRRNGRFG